MINFFSRHTLIAVYTIVFLGIMYGVYQTSGTTYFGELTLYFVALTGFYLAFSYHKIRNWFAKKMEFFSERTFNFNANYLVLLAVIVVIVHLIYLGGSPAIKAINLKSVEDVAMLRYSITDDSPKVLLYLSEIFLKGILPFLILYLLYRKQYLLYWVVLILAVFYSFSLMQKSYVVSLLLPAFIYCTAKKQFLFVTKYVVLIVIVIYGLSFVANPAPKELDKDDPFYKEKVVQQQNYSKLELISMGLYNRIFIVPGEVVSGWFETIPSQKPFLNGDGYRLFAKLQGKEHVNYSVELYPILKPHYARQGLVGTVNVASFMYEYSNFGKPGLILSGLVLAFLFFIIELFFKDDLLFKLSINLFHVLLLSSGAISTLLFSGGWGFLILCYYIFLKGKTN